LRHFYELFYVPTFRVILVDQSWLSKMDHKAHITCKLVLYHLEPRHASRVSQLGPQELRHMLTTSIKSLASNWDAKLDQFICIEKSMSFRLRVWGLHTGIFMNRK
jgi:hypothetical protein